METYRHTSRHRFIDLRVKELKRAKLDATEILKLIKEANLLQNDPPLTDNEIEKCISQTVIVKEADKNQILYTDRANAIYFKTQFADELFFCEKLGGWYMWDTTRWRYDEENLILDYAGRALDKMRVEAETAHSETFMKHIKASSSKGRIQAMIELAKGERLSRVIDSIDADDMLLNCPNGTLNLNDFTLQPHSKADYISKITKTNYIPGAQKTKWLEFLNQVFLNDQELIRYVQKVCGYAASGLSREQCMWILYGNGMNGKGVFINCMTEVLGDYVNAMPPSELILKQQEGISNETARLRAARFITTSESGQSRMLDEAKVKRLTGEEKMSARFLFHESFEFYFKGKIFFLTNHKPEIRGYDKGIWRRIKPIPFDLDINDATVDKNILEKLLAEREGILDWIIEGFRMYKLEELKEPKRVLEALEEYKEESDKFSEFLEKHCLLDSENEVSSSDLLHAANSWGKELGIRVNRNVFRDYLKKKGFELQKKSYGWVWLGIGLKESSATKDEFQFSESQRPF